MIYASHEVFLFHPQSPPIPTANYTGDGLQIGTPFGAKKILPRNPVATGHTFTFRQESNADRLALRDFFDARKGRYGAFWLPSWSSDVSVTATTAASATTLTINRTRYADWIITGHLLVRYPAADFATAVTAAVQSSATTEDLTVSATPYTIEPTTPIHTLRLVRFADDALSFELVGRTAAGNLVTTAALKLTELPRETP